MGLRSTWTNSILPRLLLMQVRYAKRWTFFVFFAAKAAQWLGLFVASLCCKGSTSFCGVDCQSAASLFSHAGKCTLRLRYFVWVSCKCLNVRFDMVLHFLYMSLRRCCSV